METVIIIKKIQLRMNIISCLFYSNYYFLLCDATISLISIKILTPLMQRDVCHVTVCLPRACLTSPVYCTRGLRKSIPVPLDLCRQTLVPQLVDFAHQKNRFCCCVGGQVITVFVLYLCSANVLFMPQCSTAANNRLIIEVFVEIQALGGIYRHSECHFTCQV